MSNSRYLEFDSSYRNRNEWPLASEFQIPISQSGRKNQSNALDPVCLSTPIMTWTSNYLDVTSSPPAPETLSGNILFKIETTPTPDIYIPTTSDNQTFVIQTPNNSLQQLQNYYIGLVITTDGTVKSRRRITGYKYLFQTNDNDYGLITIASNFPEGITDSDSFTIIDPTYVGDVNNPYFFVPSGRVQKNGYTGYLLYNENLQEYRKISEYDSITHMISLNTQVIYGDVNSGPLPSSPLIPWSTTDNYSIRKEPPYLPRNGSSYLQPVAPFSTNSITVSTLPTSDTNFYKNFAIRIVANYTIPEYYKYVDNKAIPPLNESRKIISSSYSSGNTTLTFYPPLLATPTANTYFEMLNFSYDNFNPFTYTGSLVSQQDMVCYEVELLNLILPNEVLAVGEGGRIAFYPYVYVQISNVSSACGGLKNIIYSNNPNAVSAIFRVPIDDVINPLISTFIKVDGDGMVQTIKFKPNDNLYFSVFLANGELYETILPEYFSPAPPNPTSQISASFSIRRL
jgi:hypothetical protein